MAWGKRDGAKWSNIGLGALAAVTAVLMLAAFTRDHGADNATTVTPAAPPPAEAPAPASLDPARAVLASGQPVVISVLGDSTGNDGDEWVVRWAEKLGENHKVTVHMWDAVRQDWKQDVRTFGRSGVEVTIWNASQPGETADYPADKIDRVQPEQPGLVLYNFGHNDQAGSIGPHTGQTMDAVAAHWSAQIPSAVILQNPARGDRAVTQDATLAALPGWSAQRGAPAIDVTSAFRSAGDLAALLVDELHPNPAGSQLWADTVHAALVG